MGPEKIGGMKGPPNRNLLTIRRTTVDNRIAALHARRGAELAVDFDARGGPAIAAVTLLAAAAVVVLRRS